MRELFRIGIPSIIDLLAFLELSNRIHLSYGILLGLISEVSTVGKIHYRHLFCISKQFSHLYFIKSNNKK